MVRKSGSSTPALVEKLGLRGVHNWLRRRSVRGTLRQGQFVFFGFRFHKETNANLLEIADAKSSQSSNQLLLLRPVNREVVGTEFGGR